MLEFAIKSALVSYIGLKSANRILTKSFFNPNFYTPLPKLLKGNPTLKYFRVFREGDIFHSPLFSSREVKEQL